MRGGGERDEVERMRSRIDRHLVDFSRARRGAARGSLLIYFPSKIDL